MKIVSKILYCDVLLTVMHDNICHPILYMKYQFIYNTVYNKTKSYKCLHFSSNEVQLCHPLHISVLNTSFMIKNKI